MLAPPLSGPGWLTANSCCDAFTTHRAGRTPLGGSRFVKNSLPFVLDRYTVSAAVDPASYRAAFSGTGPLELRTDLTPAVQSGTLPLNLAVVDFR